MLKIGEFARICHTSTQTLRYYDAEGILKADEIDKYTGYRYYAPEKLEVFRRIQSYKNVGFSLDEIKILLESDPARISELVAKRRRVLNSELYVTQNKLALLEELSNQSYLTGGHAVSEPPPEPFEDDPALHGRWELVGRLLSPIDGAPPPPEAPIEPVTSLQDGFPHLVFLPDGHPWWAIRWTRGTIYRLYPAYHTFIPNPYTLFLREDACYMTVRYVGGAALIKGGDPIWLLYRRTEHRDLTMAETRTHTDCVSYSFVPDPRLPGTWVSVDFVHTPAEFDPRHPRVPSTYLWILGITFVHHGLCLRRFTGGDGTQRNRELGYTATPDGPTDGTLIDPLSAVAEQYILRTLDEEEYLFIQHKTGDYIYGGLSPSYYVFRKERQT